MANLYELEGFVLTATKRSQKGEFKRFGGPYVGCQSVTTRYTMNWIPVIGHLCQLPVNYCLCTVLSNSLKKLLTISLLPFTLPNLDFCYRCDFKIGSWTSCRTFQGVISGSQFQNRPRAACSPDFEITRPITP